MKMYQKLIISCFVVLAFMALAGSAKAVTLNQTSISLAIGQSSTVSAYNTSGSIYISNNSNPSVATISVNGNSVAVYGVSIGSSTASICDNLSGCSVLYITVNGYNGYNNNVINNSGLNISSLVLPTGSSITISPSNYNYNYSAYNNTNGLYVSSNSNPNVATALASSSTTIGCYAGSLYSIITGQLCNGGYTPYYNTSYIPGCYTGSLYSTTTGQLCNGSINNSGSGSIMISAVSAGSDTITLCQTGGTACNTLSVTVTGYALPVSSPYYPNTTYNSSGVPTVYSTSTAN